MANQAAEELGAQMDRMMLPMQRVGLLMLDSFERLVRFQLGSAKTYTQFMLQQWRNVLEIRDQESLRKFFDKQSQAVQELGKKMAAGAEDLASLGQELASQAQRAAEQNVRTMTEFTQALERTASQQSAQRQGGRRFA